MCRWFDCPVNRLTYVACRSQKYAVKYYAANLFFVKFLWFLVKFHFSWLLLIRCNKKYYPALSWHQRVWPCFTKMEILCSVMAEAPSTWNGDLRCQIINLNWIERRKRAVKPEQHNSVWKKYFSICAYCTYTEIHFFKQNYVVQVLLLVFVFQFNSLLKQDFVKPTARSIAYGDRGCSPFNKLNEYRRRTVREEPNIEQY